MSIIIGVLIAVFVMSKMVESGIKKGKKPYEKNDSNSNDLKNEEKC